MIVYRVRVDGAIVRDVLCRVNYRNRIVCATRIVPWSWEGGE